MTTHARPFLVLLLWTSSVVAAPAGPPEEAEPAPAAPAAAVRLQAGELLVSSNQQWSEGSLVHARGVVDIRYRDLVLQADEVVLDRATKEVVAEGSVVLQQGERRLAGERLEFNLDQELGRMWGVQGYAEQDVFFSAREVEKTGEATYRLRGAAVTSCTQPRPHWRLKASSGSYTVDRYVRLWNARLEVLGVPLVYLPYIQYPARRERSTGFLFPSIGTNNRRGFTVTNGFFWAIGRSYDATFSHEYYRDRGSLFRTEFNYVPSRDASGSFTSENLVDTVTDSVRSRYRLTHGQRLGATWRLGATVDYASDDLIDQEFSRNISRATQRSRTSTGFLTRNWSRYSFSVSARHSELLGAREQTDLVLPAVEFGVRDTRLVGPLFLRLRSTFHHFQQETAVLPELKWERGDLEPTLSMPLQPVPWLQLKPEGGYRLTYYTKSYEPGGSRVPVEDDFLRRFGFFRALLTGPVLARVFHTPGGGYAEKYKHVIEPVTTYEYTEEIDPEGRALQSTGALDRLPSVHQLRFELRNRLLAKRAAVAGGPAVPYEFLSFVLGMNYSIDPDRGTRLDGRNLGGIAPRYAGRRRGPLEGSLRLQPGTAFNATYRFFFDTEERLFTSHSLQATWRRRSWFGDATFTRTRGLDAVTSNSVRGNAGFTLFAERLQLQGGGSYDFLLDDLRDLGVNGIVHTQCCGLGVGYLRRNLGPRDDREFRFSVSLKNVGTVFDYTLGDDRL